MYVTAPINEYGIQIISLYSNYDNQCAVMRGDAIANPHPHRCYTNTHFQIRAGICARMHTFSIMCTVPIVCVCVCVCVTCLHSCREFHLYFKPPPTKIVHKVLSTVYTVSILTYCSFPVLSQLITLRSAFSNQSSLQK